MKQTQPGGAWRVPRGGHSLFPPTSHARWRRQAAAAAGGGRLQDAPSERNACTPPARHAAPPTRPTHTHRLSLTHTHTCCSAGCLFLTRVTRGIALRAPGGPPPPLAPAIWGGGGGERRWGRLRVRVCVLCAHTHAEGGEGHPRRNGEKRESVEGRRKKRFTSRRPSQTLSNSTRSPHVLLANFPALDKPR